MVNKTVKRRIYRRKKYGKKRTIRRIRGGEKLTPELKETIMQNLDELINIFEIKLLDDGKIQIKKTINNNLKLINNDDNLKTELINALKNVYSVEYSEINKRVFPLYIVLEPEKYKGLWDNNMNKSGEYVEYDNNDENRIPEYIKSLKTTFLKSLTKQKPTWQAVSDELNTQVIKVKNAIDLNTNGNQQHIEQ